MSRKNQPKQVEEVVEIKEEEKTEEVKTPEKEEVKEETKAPETEEKPSEEETTETPEDVKEPEKEEKIDPRIATMIALNRKTKISEKDKQSKIYSAMANIKVVRS